MKFLFIIILLNYLPLDSNANKLYRSYRDTSTQDTQYIKQRAEKLKKAYKKLSSDPYVVKYEKEYFEAFPNSFELFNHLFGYADKDPLGKGGFDSPLYEEAVPYVMYAFFNLHDIEKHEFYNRIIDISINGKWFVDAVSYFQHNMRDTVNADVDMFCELLSKRSDKEIKSFWYFYFDGIYPDKDIPKELSIIKTSYPKIYILLEEAHAEALKNGEKYNDGQ